jgi:hypothetical protein
MVVPRDSEIGNVLSCAVSSCTFSQLPSCYDEATRRSLKIDFCIDTRHFLASALSIDITPNL